MSKLSKHMKLLIFCVVVVVLLTTLVIAKEISERPILDSNYNDKFVFVISETTYSEDIIATVPIVVSDIQNSSIMLRYFSVEKSEDVADDQFAYTIEIVNPDNAPFTFILQEGDSYKFLKDLSLQKIASESVSTHTSTIMTITSEEQSQNYVLGIQWLDQSIVKYTYLEEDYVIYVNIVKVG